MKLSKLLQTRFDPDKAVRPNSQEEEYRRGYRDGYILCAQEVWGLYDKGYVRPREIGTILHEFSVFGDLSKWEQKDDPDFQIAPRPQQPSWYQMRSKIINRDQCCVWCGSFQELEVDHIQPVKDYGWAEERNLRVLCKKCHNSRR